MKCVKNFLLRGLMFGGFGPIIFGIVCLLISFNGPVPFTGIEIMIAIFSTYLLAFIHAGTSVFKEVENWSLVKASGLQLLVLYILYTVCYLINSWLPFNWVVLLIFTVCFILVYLIIWFIVYLIVKKTTKDLNDKLR